MSNSIMSQPYKLNLEGLTVFPALSPLLEKVLTLPSDVVMIKGPCLVGKRGTYPHDAIIAWANAIIQVIEDGSGKIKNHNNFILSNGTKIKLKIISRTDMIWSFE